MPPRLSEMTELLLFRELDFDLACRDLAKRGDHFLVVGLDQWWCPLEQLLGATRAREHQLETIGNVLETIFYCNSCHVYANCPAPRRLCQRKSAMATATGRPEIRPSSTVIEARLGQHHDLCLALKMA